MERREVERSSEAYFADRAEHLIRQIVGTTDAVAGHPAATELDGLRGRIAALEDRLADAERRLARLESPRDEAKERAGSGLIEP